MDPAAYADGAKMCVGFNGDVILLAELEEGGSFGFLKDDTSKEGMRMRFFL